MLVVTSYILGEIRCWQSFFPSINFSPRVSCFIPSLKIYKGTRAGNWRFAWISQIHVNSSHSWHLVIDSGRLTCIPLESMQERR